MTFPPNHPLHGIGPDHLAAAMRQGRDPGFGAPPPDAEDLVRIARRGPASLEEALQVLGSTPARQLLSVMWRSRCPSPDILDAAVPGPGSDDDEQLRAQGVELLVQGLHARNCPRCRARLRELQDALAAFDQDTAGSPLVPDAWLLELFPAAAGVRSPAGGQAAGVAAELTDDEQFLALVGRARLERERSPRITAAPDPEDPGTLRITLVLPAPAAAQVQHVLAVLGTGDAAAPVRLSFSDADRLLLQGTCTAPPAAADGPLQVALRPVLRTPAPGAEGEPA